MSRATGILAAHTSHLPYVPVFEPPECALDLGEFLRFQLSERGGDFLAAGVERRVGRVTRSRRVLRMSEILQLDPEPLAEFKAPGQQGSYEVSVVLLAVPLWFLPGAEHPSGPNRGSIIGLR